MRRRGRLRAATRPAPQRRSNPSFCAKKRRPDRKGASFFAEPRPAAVLSGGVLPEKAAGTGPAAAFAEQSLFSGLYLGANQEYTDYVHRKTFLFSPPGSGPAAAALPDVVLTRESSAAFFRETKAFGTEKTGSPFFRKEGLPNTGKESESYAVTCTLVSGRIRPADQRG